MSSGIQTRRMPAGLAPGSVAYHSTTRAFALQAPKCVSSLRFCFLCGSVYFEALGKCTNYSNEAGSFRKVKKG